MTTDLSVPSDLNDLNQLQAALQAAGAARLDAVGWHYIEVLSERARSQTGPAQALLNDKLKASLIQFKQRWDDAPRAAAKASPPARVASPSPLAALLSDMAQHAPAPNTAPSALSVKPAAWRAESPRVQQFKKQLGKMSVQKQVKQAIALAPQNAGPINSHMLVLRSLGLMRDASPDYLNRFITYVDTLLCLEEAGKASAQPKKPSSTAKPKK
jgi:Protein of unknown function (DUF2894)